ncbi:MAG: indolepyruvate ferredoxin oxidoreductase subunit alpha [Lachnospiraceae bacterium]|nr:indolepyruvate ferredoxin oxidoreductase subunit alpha [Lachnospiraceae bacterium]
MHNEFMMGNQAIAMAAIAAGVNLVSGYPGTPSSEVLETVAKKRLDNCYVEWSVNEKSAMEVAAGAAYTGARTMVTMKQVGLNVASDPLMSLEYIGVKGGMVVLVADDPGPISSQTEQDTRTFAIYSKLPCFDPSSVEEAYQMVIDAFDYSEKYHTPVFLRPTTRVCHAYQSVLIRDEEEYHLNSIEGFVKDSKKWVIFPRLSNINHRLIEERNDELSTVFSSYSANKIINKDSQKLKAIAASGICYSYVLDVLEEIKTEEIAVLKVSTPFPFPYDLTRDFLKNHDEVLCFEELDPVIERALDHQCGIEGISCKVRGKLTKDSIRSGEYSIDLVREKIYNYLGLELKEDKASVNPPELPVRPPVLCAGCPHRASFYAVKQAMKGKKTIYCGDIGCYTLGNAMPLDMVDTCLCMGAGLGIAQGVNHIEPDTVCFAFVGDSTFFASAITGVVNAVYNQADMTLIVLDNSTTAMTGHQPHPGTGRTMMGDIVNKISIEAVLKGIGVEVVKTVDPLDYELAVDTVKEVANLPGVKAIIFKSPCIAIVKPNEPYKVCQGDCINCKRCINEIGCPAIFIDNGKVTIDNSLCTGCGLCSKICPVTAIRKAGEA